MGRKLLVNGTVYDGKGNEPVVADILIQDDKIAAIGENLDRDGADEVFDVSGLTVTPGFVDMHRHCDKSPFETAEGENTYGKVMLRQGITTTATGNCGISMYPLSSDGAVVEEMRNYYAPVLGNIDAYGDIATYGDYRKRLKECQLPVNTAAMIGMGAIRIAVKGFSEERFTESEIKQCQNIIEDALKQGAPGVSIGLMYLPECFETVEELGEILKPVGTYGRIVTAHIRGEGDSLVKSVEEVVRIGRIAGCRMEVSHFKSCGMANWNREIHKAIELIEAARRDGIAVDCDFYPYDCGSTTLLSMIPPEFVNGNIPEALARLQTKEGRDALRDMLERTYDNWDNYAISLGWDKVIISAASKSENQDKIGKSITEIVEAFHYEDEVEAVSDILVSENGTAAIIIRSMEQSDIDVIAKLPYSCVISDAIYAETDRPHPRMYGAFPRLIHDYVYQRKVLTLKDAIRKMTSMPAQRMGLEMRGVIEEGAYADINVFDAMKFKDMATYVESTRYAKGLNYCFLNGNLVVKDDEVLLENCGRVL